MRKDCENIFMYIKNLPPLLSKKEEELLLKELPDPRAREDLITRNLRLIFHIIETRFSNTAVSEDDLFSIGSIGLIKAIDSYNPNRNIKLSTYTGKCIQNEILMYLRKENKSLKCVSLSLPLYKDKNGSELFIEDVCADSKSSLFYDLYPDLDSFFSILNYFSNTLFEKSYRDFIIFFYMLGGNNQKISANVFNLSQSYISRLFKNFHNRVISLNNSEHLPEKLIHSNYFLFFLKDTELCVGISKIILDDSVLDLFPNEYTNDTYFFVKYPFLQESFIDFADFFRHLCDLHLIRN